MKAELMVDRGCFLADSGIHLIGVRSLPHCHQGSHVPSVTSHSVAPSFRGVTTDGQHWQRCLGYEADDRLIHGRRIHPRGERESGVWSQLLYASESITQAVRVHCTTGYTCGVLVKGSIKAIKQCLPAIQQGWHAYKFE